MNPTDVLLLGREALMMALILSVPIIGVGMLVGLVVSLFQSMTQLQEQTLSFVPKIVAMVGIALLLIPWLAGRIMEYASQLFGISPF
ncbi:MAG: flagellar biosynthesis protein FliQ [Planctomycetota bacterium]|nr:MAG: flagellar biosynthesis protein FliQ [Planctomycetota bacterium]